MCRHNQTNFTTEAKDPAITKIPPQWDFSCMLIFYIWKFLQDADLSDVDRIFVMLPNLKTKASQRLWPHCALFVFYQMQHECSLSAV